MKLITFSLWGMNPKYTQGAIKNAELAPEIYPGWKCRFYLGASTPKPVEHQLRKYDHVEVVNKPEWGDWRGMFWRFEPASEDDVEVMISRDCDSRLNKREASAVEEWLKTDRGFHIMRDHPYHQFAVLGGMWGAKKGTVPRMKELIYEWGGGTDKYGTDYDFFVEKILPTMDQEVLMVHDEFFKGIPFPTPRQGLEFVGQVFDEEDRTLQEHLQILRRWYEDPGSSASPAAPGRRGGVLGTHKLTKAQ
tara:strand:- start:5513 stop:6256 length:744 start_codon:yes stop_codon:yes gene_type:complete